MCIIKTCVHEVYILHTTYRLPRKYPASPLLLIQLVVTMCFATEMAHKNLIVLVSCNKWELVILLYFNTLVFH